MNFELLKSAARYYKENPEGVEIMCKAFEEIRNEKAIRIAKNIMMMALSIAALLTVRLS